MKRRINHTQRKRITREHIKLSLRQRESEQRPFFDLTLDLSSYNFPKDATVRVEARRGHSAQRWSFGAVAHIEPPSEEDRRITQVDDAALFRILVVAGDGSGKLLGHADHLKPVRAIESLLHLEESPQLGAEVWRVEFDDSGGQPKLLINSKIEGISTIATGEPSFYALVIPEVLRAVLTRILIVDGNERDDDSGAWYAEWLDLATSYASRNAEPPALRDDDDDRREEAHAWIDDVVQRFAERTLDAANSYAAAVSDKRS
ncbi:MAG: hypothetical protein OXG61_08190 [Chloroflexi bacterium]|nr:hypothetical protein [Chloroflexota bacterium]